MLAGLRHPQVDAYSRAINDLHGLIRGERPVLDHRASGGGEPKRSSFAPGRY